MNVRKNRTFGKKAACLLLCLALCLLQAGIASAAETRTVWSWQFEIQDDNTAKIIAPIDGTVAQVDVKPFDVITYESNSAQRNILAVRIDDLTSHYIDISVTELEVNNISIGQDVTITFDAIPLREYTGTIEKRSLCSAAGSDFRGRRTDPDCTETHGGRIIYRYSGGGWSALRFQCSGHIRSAQRRR